MEQVIRTYGRFVLEAVVFGLLLWLLMAGMVDEQGHQGIFSMMGAQIQEETAFYRGDIECYRQEGEKTAPSISYVYSQVLGTGSYGLDEIVIASDSGGERIPVIVESICDPYGVVQIGGDLSEASQLSFMVPGIYTLRVSAKDAENRVTICEFRVPVNSSGVMY